MLYPGSRSRSTFPNRKTHLALRYRTALHSPPRAGRARSRGIPRSWLTVPNQAVDPVPVEEEHPRVPLLPGPIEDLAFAEVPIDPFHVPPEDRRDLGGRIEDRRGEVVGVHAAPPPFCELRGYHRSVGLPRPGSV